MAQTSRGVVNLKVEDDSASDSECGRRKIEKRKRDQFRLADLICTALIKSGHERPLPMFPDFAWDLVLTWRRNLEFVHNRHWHGAVAECRKELDSALHELVDQANTARQRLRDHDEEPIDVRLHDLFDELVALDLEFGEVVMGDLAKHLADGGGH